MQKIIQSHFKNITKISIITIVLLFSLKFGQSTPFEAIFFKVHAVFLGGLTLYLLFYVGSFSIRHERINYIVLYFLILIAVIPFYSAYRANIEFGQPYIYGILSERGWVVICVGIWFYRMLVTKKTPLVTIESTFVFMAWASLVFFLLVMMTYDSSQLTSDSNFVRDTADRGLRFKFQYYFITFGAIYYLVKHAVYKKNSYLLFSIIFLSYIVFVVQGRFYIIAMAVTIFLFYWTFYQAKRTLIFVNMAFLLCSAGIFIQLISPEYFERAGSLFTQMFTVLMGDESQDMSANARIHATRIVLAYFDSHPISLFLGTGKISNQWYAGYESIFGHFFPSDIGVLGGIFLYGVTGAIFLCLIPIIILLKIMKRIGEKKNSFILTLKYMIVFSLVTTIQGSFYFNLIDYIIPLFIVLAYQEVNGRRLDGRN
jgi:hypothetical protein